MAVSELQWALIAAGGAAVVAVVAYNKWQESRHRKRAEQAFGGEQPDVLLEPGLHEPRIGDGVLPVDADEPPARPVREQPIGRGSPSCPLDASELADCVVRIEAIEALSASRLWTACAESMGDVGKPLRWYGFEDASNLWVEVDKDSAGAHHWFAAALQLVDRRGPVGETELVRFFHGLQRVADQFLAVPAELPPRNEVLAKAQELDSFCASVDVQIGLNVVAREAPFVGTKIRALAESQGWVLAEDGGFHAVDGEGRELFSVSNLDGAAFSPEEMRTLHTRGITLLLDVPRIANGVQAFEQMLVSARQLAETLGGTVVDDNNSPFGDQEAHVIRGQIDHFQGRMNSRGLEPGGEVARRLFAT
ncbi:MAG: cell division protein ZipA C-terminal FtsZ-binding domain-containing protein [Zoogloeaceae bacterium]|nr:cell division protein ZipA C-terminal FtsZ-binding domain-containing protein [Rhodocyclaceae bacterium]MCP5236199.1 cell division protein ZipA C-terminal FtsZ-binding domain-containing protein [Zoogloeaceae bacterium]